MRLEIELTNKWRQAHQEGRREGRREGRQEALKEPVLELLASKGEIPEDLRSMIEGQTDETMLKQWLIAAGEVESPEDFRKAM